MDTYAAAKRLWRINGLEYTESVYGSESKSHVCSVYTLQNNLSLAI